ncbi:NTP transferase domain-containing protein [Candidatus Bathyarchaeota archaeon]|jgi:bifunctional UDP-N-acetylglucosamine pyrophosphorylase / glucosamine-1-phosphate N-acetyltransferase|nr:NTP transferase domain-containing protein [Candidatus Bathyarchaeota archaeon]
MTKQDTKTSAIVLAAGRGTRMNSIDKNKVTVKLNGQPMVRHTIDHLREANIDQIIVVVGFQADSVRSALGDSVEYVVQKNQLGTGDAVATALPALVPAVTTVLAVYGDDSSFYPPSLYQEMIAKQQSTLADVLVLTIKKNDPTGLGRIIRDQSGKISKIVEEKNATPEERETKEINTGFYCFDRQFLDAHITSIKPNPVTGELYATDLVEIALSAGKKVETYFLDDSSVWHGVNTQEDYEKARIKYQEESHA